MPRSAFMAIRDYAFKYADETALHQRGVATSGPSPNRRAPGRRPRSGVLDMRTDAWFIQSHYNLLETGHRSVCVWPLE